MLERADEAVPLQRRDRCKTTRPRKPTSPTGWACCSARRCIAKGVERPGIELPRAFDDALHRRSSHPVADPFMTAAPASDRARAPTSGIARREGHRYSRERRVASRRPPDACWPCTSSRSLDRGSHRRSTHRHRHASREVFPSRRSVGPFGRRGTQRRPPLCRRQDATAA